MASRQSLVGSKVIEVTSMGITDTYRQLAFECFAKASVAGDVDTARAPRRMGNCYIAQTSILDPKGSAARRHR
jgi:hypothetical protein